MRREFPALGFDPAPGDPAALTAAAERTATAARAYGRAAERMDRLTATSWTGDAGDSFRTKIGPLPGDLDHAHRAHGVVARELADFGVELGARQRRADELEARAVSARAREAAAVTEVNGLAATTAPVGSGEFAELRAEYGAARARAETAGADLEAIIREARLLLAEHDAAATAAASAIRAASDAPYEKPGRLKRALGRVKRWITEHVDVLTTISTVLKAVSAVLGVIAIVPGFQFLAPFAIAAGAIALALDLAIKLATGQGSWRSFALDAALTVLPTGRVVRSLHQLHDVNVGVKYYSGKIPGVVKGKLFRRLGHLPEGITQGQLDRAGTLIREQAGHYGDDVIVHGSRAEYRSFPISDIDVGLRVSPEEFARIHKERFSVNVNTDDEKGAVVRSMTKGIIHGPRAGLKGLTRDLEGIFGKDKVDISVIRRGGYFDLEPWLPL